MLVHFLQSKLEESYHCSCHSLVFKIPICKQNEFALLLQLFLFQNFTLATTRNCLVHIFEALWQWQRHWGRVGQMVLKSPQHQALSLWHLGLAKTESKGVGPGSWNFPAAVTARGRAVGLVQWWMRKPLLWGALTWCFFFYWHYIYHYTSSLKKGKTVLYFPLFYLQSMLMLHHTVFYFSSEQSENTKQFKLFFSFFPTNPNIIICRILEQNKIE